VSERLRSSGGERRGDAVRNRQDILRAAPVALHRDGLHVAMGTIATEAGVGVGTLYRHFATRADLLSALTHRSFESVLAHARAAERDGATPAECLRRFIEAAIRQRNELVLPMHGGPPVTAPSTIAIRAEVHAIVERIIDRGITEQSLDPELTARDVITFGALLAQPRPPDPVWDATRRRLLETYLRGASVRRQRARRRPQ
jgi:AcrR family transcriptional regulator